MMIGTCGFISTGSSAVSDLLKEFDENQVMDGFEFALVHAMDSIEDLTYHVMQNGSRCMSGGVAIERFRRYIKTSGALRRATQGRLDALTDEYLDQIIQARWRGYGSAKMDMMLFPGFKYKYIGVRLMRDKVHPRLSKKFGRTFDFYPVRGMELCVRPDRYYEHTRRYVSKILDAMGWDRARNLVLDQPFAASNPQKSFEYFDDPRAIVVDRDPRDVYLFAKKVLLHKVRAIPTERVEDFVAFYRALRKDMPYLQERGDILRIRFEDMVYEYDESVRRIMDFCGLREHSRPRSIFEPNLSINNTQLFRRYPQYAQDIAYIERELPEYLVPFERYGAPAPSGEMFYGRSPLNKR